MIAPATPIVGAEGYGAPVEWASRNRARELGRELADAYNGEIVRNPHLTEAWARSIVTAPALVGAMRARLGRGGLTLRGSGFGHPFTPLPLNAGRAVCFDSRLVHRSGPNRSEAARVGLNIRYATPDGFHRGSAATRPGWMPLDLP